MGEHKLSIFTRLKFVLPSIEIILSKVEIRFNKDSMWTRIRAWILFRKLHKRKR